jgi:hypothetical protein
LPAPTTTTSVLMEESLIGWVRLWLAGFEGAHHTVGGARPAAAARAVPRGAAFPVRARL